MIRNGSERGIGSLSAKILAGKYTKKEMIELVADHMMIIRYIDKNRFVQTLREIEDYNIFAWDKVLKALRKRGLRL